MASPTHDQTAPMIHALSVWLQVPEAGLLVAEADGHQSWLVSRCVFDAQLGFLLDPTSAQRSKSVRTDGVGATPCTVAFPVF